MFAFAAAMVLALPAQAQEAEEAPDIFGQMLERFAERTEEAMRDMIEEIEPEMQQLFDELGPEMERLMGSILPELQELGETLGGLTLYELPEVLPNGDIIIRRRRDAPPLPEDLQDRLGEDGPVEL